MAVIVNSNIASLNAQKNLTKSQGSLATALQRLSSGLRINSAKDDAAGLYVSQQLTRDLRGTNQAIRNAGDGISLGQTAEGALGEVGNLLQRIREIAVQSVNATVGDRTGLTAEATQLQQQIVQIVDGTDFNGTALLDNTTALVFQVGSDAGDTVSVSASDLTSIVGYTAVDVSTSAAANTALGTLTTSIDTVSTSRATFGAVQNRFEAVISNLSQKAESIAASRSRIQDADFAAETANLTRAQILQQAGISILAQANAQSQSALSLLG